MIIKAIYITMWLLIISTTLFGILQNHTIIMMFSGRLFLYGIMVQIVLFGLEHAIKKYKNSKC